MENLFFTEIKTPLGTMIAVASPENLRHLFFKSQWETAPEIQHKNTDPLKQITHELDLYFKGQLKEFQTPFHVDGTQFQIDAWEALSLIPYGHVTTYQEQAEAINKPKAYRAVANANGRNPLPILIPCHRVIRQNGDMGGYSCGIDKKIWLLKHEDKYRD